jgi:hypothetical protein
MGNGEVGSEGTELNMDGQDAQDKEWPALILSILFIHV